MVSAHSHRTLTPVPASRGEGQVHAADLQRAGVGGAQLDKEHGWVRAGARDLAGVHVVSVRPRRTPGTGTVSKSDPPGARVVSASRPEGWALPTVFDFNELMRHAGVTDQ